MPKLLPTGVVSTGVKLLPTGRIVNGVKLVPTGDNASLAPAPTNVPTRSLSVAASLGDTTSQPSHLALVGDACVCSVVTSDTDGATTTGVNLYEAGLGLIGAFTNDGSGNWHYNFAALAAGDYTYFARRVTAGGSIDSANWVLKSVYTPPQNFGTTRLKNYRYCKAADITQAAGVLSQWNDISGNATVTNGTAASTAQPTFNPYNLAVGSNDLSLQGLDYTRYDGVANRLSMTALNLGTPGATVKNFGWMVVRAWAAVINKRYLGAIGAVNIQIIAITPTATQLEQYNGTFVNPVAHNNQGEWNLLMFEFGGTTADFLQIMNYLATGSNAGTAATSTGRYEANDGTAARFAGIDVQQAGYVSGTTVVTAQEKARLVDWVNYLAPPTVFKLGAGIPKAVIVMEGDSLSAVPYQTGSYVNYPQQFITRPSLIKRYFIAKDGDTSANALADYPTQARPKVNSGNDLANPVVSIYSLLVGVNDIVLLGSSANTIYNNIVSTLILANADGFKNILWLLINGAFTVPQLAVWNALNALLIAGFPNYGEAAPIVHAPLVDARGKIPGTFRDGTYWAAGVAGDFHPATLGWQSVAYLQQAAVEYLVPP